MKKTISFLSIVMLLTVNIPFVFASKMEKARLIRTNNQYHDSIIERSNGERWLIQHHRKCSSMSSEFPITLVWSGDEMTQMKIGFNEICEIYNAIPYFGEARLMKLFKSENLIIPDHEAELIWKGKRHLVDYGEGCNYLKDFLNKRVYLYFENESAKNATLVQPGHRGQCPITFKDELEIVKDENSDAPHKLHGLDHQAQNNQVYFYWEHPKERKERLRYLISYSRYEIDPDDYNSWREMPNIKVALRNSYTVKRLANGRQYYFYLAAMNSNGAIGKWTAIESTPVAPPPQKKYGYMPEKFEIELSENDTYYTLKWPEKEHAKRYRVLFYIDGKLTYFKFHDIGENKFRVEKQKINEGRKYKLMVRTIPKDRYGPRLRDGHYWVYESEE